MVTSRIWFTAAQKAELWERWKNGQSAAAISRALEIGGAPVSGSIARGKGLKKVPTRPCEEPSGQRKLAGHTVVRGSVRYPTTPFANTAIPLD